jgi:ribosomal protein S27AE
MGDNNMAKISQFIRGDVGRPGATYTCDMCGKRTRETGAQESSCGLCRQCYIETMMENSLSDGRVQCPKCGEHSDVTIDNERFICGKCGSKSEKEGTNWYGSD